MTHFRFIPLAFALAAASTLIACNTAPAMPMGAATSNNMGMPDSVSKMDAQMKTMQAMMEGLSGGGMGSMKSMPGMSGGTGMHQQMMEKRMEMMQAMMKIMMDRMPTAPAK